MNDYEKIGKRIFEKIPNLKVPFWGSLLLAEFRDSPIVEPSEISELRDLINSCTWEMAHEQFAKIRRLTLNNRDELKEIYLLLAENISKTTYNQSETETPFDSDSGFWIYQLALKLAKSTSSKHKEDRIMGILNLFESSSDSENHFAKETISSFSGLIAKVFTSDEEDKIQLRKELPIGCSAQEIQLTNSKSRMYTNNEMWPDGSFEFQFDITFEERKIGYYALIWDVEVMLMDEFYVID